VTVASIFEARNVTIALIDAAVWAAWSVLVGYAGHRIPRRRLAGAGAGRRARCREVVFYERVLRIRTWKRWLPEAGDLFAGGFSKRRLTHRDRDYLTRFVVETRRAELVHWLVMAIGPLFFLWNPWWLGVAMLGYAVGANAPCLVTQRYNRARLLRVLARTPAERT